MLVNNVLDKIESFEKLRFSNSEKSKCYQSDLFRLISFLQVGYRRNIWFGRFRREVMNESGVEIIDSEGDIINLGLYGVTTN